MFDAEPQNSSITLQKGRGRLVVAAFSSLTRILLNKEYSFHKWIYACLESLSVIHDTGRCAVVAMKFVVSGNQAIARKTPHRHQRCCDDITKLRNAPHDDADQSSECKSSDVHSLPTAEFGGQRHCPILRLAESQLQLFG